MSKTAFITKYALTKGIYECEVKRLYDNRMTVVYWPTTINEEMMFYNEDVCDTVEEARLEVDQMIQKKLKSIEKQIENLKNKEVPVIKITFPSDED